MASEAAVLHRCRLEKAAKVEEAEIKSGDAHQRSHCLTKGTQLPTNAHMHASATDEGGPRLCNAAKHARRVQCSLVP